MIHEQSSPDEPSVELLRYMHGMLVAEDFTLPLSINPLLLVGQFLGGDMSFTAYQSASADMIAACWKYLGDRNLLRDLTTKTALSVRLAICVLSATHGADLADQREWFNDVLHRAVSAE